jgi:hypothetical protein
MKTTKPNAEITLESVLTPRAKISLERIARDHALTTRSIVTAALDHAMREVEVDIASGGLMTGGDNERMLVCDAKRVISGKPLSWSPPDFDPKYEIGSKSFADMQRACRARDQRRRRREARDAKTGKNARA